MMNKILYSSFLMVNFAAATLNNRMSHVCAPLHHMIMIWLTTCSSHLTVIAEYQVLLAASKSKRVIKHNALFYLLICMQWKLHWAFLVIK